MKFKKSTFPASSARWRQQNILYYNAMQCLLPSSWQIFSTPRKNQSFGSVGSQHNLSTARFLAHGIFYAISTHFFRHLTDLNYFFSLSISSHWPFLSKFNFLHSRFHINEIRMRQLQKCPFEPRSNLGSVAPFSGKKCPFSPGNHVHLREKSVLGARHNKDGLVCGFTPGQSAPLSTSPHCTPVTHDLCFCPLNSPLLFLT